jgi:hypothetical protein
MLLSVIIIANALSHPIQYFSLLFYVDRKESIWMAYKRAMQMFWYNMPAISIYSLLFGLLSIVAYLPAAGLVFVFTYIPMITLIINQYMTILFNLAYICLMTNLYIKLVHEQYDLYFPADVHNE